MPGNALNRVASRLSRDASRVEATSTDRDLLMRFLNEQDEEAFEILVRRHERLVNSAIAKVQLESHDREDVFQATFLILVRRAKSIDWRVALGPWLYGVAHRVAVKARATSRTRLRKETQASIKTEQPKQSEESCELSWREACALLHTELDKLPDRYRLPLLLCYLEGKTRDEAATALKISAGTLKGRLERGRELLRGRLARRGVTLSVGLLTAVASNQAKAADRHLAGVLEAVRGSASEQVVQLTREAVAWTILAKTTKWVVVLLGLGAIVSGLFAGSGASPAGPPAEQKSAEQKSSAPQPEKKDAPETQKNQFLVNVVVKKPDGKPAAGASVWIWADEKKQVEGKTDANGRADLIVPTFFPSVTVFASAAGFAPDWAEFTPTFLGRQVIGAPLELKLVEEGLPVEVRLTDLEGRPLANVPVELTRYAKLRPNQTWADFRAKSVKQDYALSSILRVRAEAAGFAREWVTDKDGRLKLTGVGNDRFICFITRGKTHEHVMVRVVCRKIERSEELPGDSPLVGASGAVHLAPARPLTGTIRDFKTGDPVPGMKVMDVHRTMTETVTDKNGQFTLYGVKKQPVYWVTCGPLSGTPYFGTDKQVPDSPGFDAMTVDLKVHRGIVLTGRVTDQAGQPVAGQIFYNWTRDNPHLKEYSGLEKGMFDLGTWGRMDRDGYYKILAIPGPGVVGVLASPENRYPRLNTRKELTSRGVVSEPSAAMHGVVSVNVDAKEPKTQTHDFKLNAGLARKLVIEGIDGKLPEKLLAVGHTEEERAQTLSEPTLLLSGLSPQRSRAVVVIDAARTMGAVAEVKGDADTPITVKLEKLGSLTGRVLDPEGKPAVGAEVRVWLLLETEKYENLPFETFATLGVFGITHGAWQQFTGRVAKTDKDGRFTIPGMLPGQKYRLMAGYKVEKRGGEIYHQKSEVTVKPGETHDLGDLKAQR